MADLASALLGPALAADPTRPLLTFYDDATGERVELSAATLENWVAKAANLLQDGLSVEPGETVGVLLPAHWQSAVALLATWSVGAQAVLGAAAADVVLAAEERLAEADAREVVGFSLAPMNRPLAAAPAGVTDFAAEVLSYGDRFAPYAPVDPAAPALNGMSGTGLLERAAERARQLGLAAGDRVLVTVGYADVDGVLDGLLAPLVAGASIVLCRNPDLGALERRAETERVTARVAP